MRNKLAILLLLSIFKVTPSFSQIDTAFWFAAPWVTPDHAARHPIVMRIATFAAPTTTVRLRQPAMPTSFHKYDTTFVMTANSVVNVRFWKDAPATLGNRGWDSLEVRPADQVVPYGLYISTSDNVSVVYDVITTGNNPETMSLKGQNGLGTEFVCPHQTQWFNQFKTDFASTPPGVNQPKQQINIVGTKANTVVWITPKCAIVGHAANVTYSIMLANPGDAYTLENTTQSTNVAGNNLSGTIISSDKPIAVTVADDSVRNPSGGCHDLIGDQIVPVDIVGKDYIMNKGNMNAGALEGGYIVGTENFTSVQITNALSAVTNTIINKGETFFYSVQTPMTYVQSNKPVYCYQTDGIGCEGGSAILPPLSCAGSSLVAFARNQPNQFFLNILCKTGAQNSFTINGSTVLIPGSAFTVVPGTGGLYQAAQIPFSLAQIPIGSYTVGNNTPPPLDNFALGIFDGSAGGGMNFYYMSSFIRRVDISTNSMTPVCAVPGATCLLTGTISGGAITGTWAASGSGTIDPVYTSTLNTVSTIYTLSPADLLATSLTFTLGSTGNCVPKTITVSVNINKPPTVVGTVTAPVQCKNAAVTTLTLQGAITNAAGGLWTGGNGGSYGVPGANTTYTPSLTDIASGLITFSLSSQGPLPGCVNVGATYTAAFIDPPTITMATSTVACTNSQSVAVQATVSPVSSSLIWVPVQGYYSPSYSLANTAYFFGGTDLQQSSVTLTLTASNTDTNSSITCSATPKTIVVNIVPQPSISLSTSSVVCALAGTLNLNGTISGGGASALTWSTSNGTGAFVPAIPASLTNTNYVLGANDTIVGVSTLTFIASSSGGFCPTVSNTITVDITKVPLITVNQNTAACQFAAITLSGSVSGYTNTGYWYSGGSAGNSAYTPSNPANGGFFPSYKAMGGQYFPSQSDINAGYVVLTLYNDTVPGIDCSGYKSFTVTFVPSPLADFSFGTKRCVGDPVTFVNTSNLNGTTLNSAFWDFDNGFTSISTGSTISTYTAPGIYHITFSVSGTNSLNIVCADTVGKDISVNPLPFPDFTVQNACVGVTVVISNQSLPANGQFTWFFGSSATPSVSTAQTPQNVSFGQAGTQSIDLIEMVAATQCTATVRKNVNVNPLPDANFGMTNNPTVAQEPVYYSDFSVPQSTANTYYWNFGDEDFSTDQNPTHYYQNGGIFYVTMTVRDALGCTDTVTKRIEVNLIPQVPTGFTPNGDGHNDLLFVKGGPFKAMKFRVYNNWGEKIFETEDQLKGWDGTKDGKDQPVGVYVWTLEVDLYNNRTVRKNGDVTLMR